MNCVYSRGARSREIYAKCLASDLVRLGRPTHMFVELVDASFTAPHPAFPSEVRMSPQDVMETFPGARISFVPTYIYPKNSSSKTLYHIVGGA